MSEKIRISIERVEQFGRSQSLCAYFKYHLTRGIEIFINSLSALFFSAIEKSASENFSLNSHPIKEEEEEEEEAEKNYFHTYRNEYN